MRAAALLLALLSPAALAHDTWLVADGPLLRVITGAHFPKAGTPVAPERIAAGNLAAAGDTVRWATLVPLQVELDEKEVAHYLDEIAAPDYVRRAWEAAGPARRWREVYVKHVKTFQSAGAPWSVPVGQGLEIVPDADPAALRAGATLKVTVLQEGRPLPALSLACIDSRGAVRRRALTDKAGKASCRLDSAGPWLLRAVEVRRARRAGADWESEWTMLTVGVAP
jgi:hypothetical protein